ncbi:hypothetical protein SANA_14350 [Gottschalkiaceae bacterium SANA]|nr:hypothetical protein SANA_14350 [Gottschalkiaceae bacterium SANA]
MIRFETKRCLIRNFIEGDIEEFMDYRNDKNWMQYQGFTGLTREEYKEALLTEGSVDEGMQLAIVCKSNSKLLGDLYLKKCGDVFWIGYTISPLYARQGYAYETTLALLEWIKGQGISKVYAGVLPENRASIQLLKKLGFTCIERDENEEDIFLLEVES